MRFWCQLGSILPPQIHQNPPKIDPKRHQNFDRFLLRFFLDFGSVLGAKLEPGWSHVRHILSYSRTRLALFLSSFLSVFEADKGSSTYVAEYPSRMLPRRFQDASKIDPNFERQFFEKTLFFHRKNHDFPDSGDRSWE